MLAQAASMLDLERLGAFSVEPGDYQHISGIYHAIFRMSEWNVEHVRNSFRHLTRLVLQINTMDDSNLEDKWLATLESGKIAMTLNFAPNLHHLELSLGSCRHAVIPQLSALLGDGTWRYLRSFSLKNMNLRGNELVSFLTGHGGSLRSLSLRDVSIHHHRAPGQGPKPWTVALRHMRILELTELFIVPIEDVALDSSKGCWMLDNAKAISRFLASGGSTWFADQDKMSEEEQRRWLDDQRKNERLQRELQNTA